MSRLSKEREAAIDNMLDSTTHSRLELQAALYDQQQELRAVRSELDEARRERDALKFGLDLPDTDPYARRIIGHDASMCPLCGYVVCPALLSKKEHLP